MKIEATEIDYSSFLDQFDYLSKNQSNYIRLNKTKINNLYSFEIISNKKDKNLITKTILSISNLSFNHLLKNKAFEDQAAFDQRQIALNKLAIALQSYGKQLHQKAPWYRKILTFFGFKNATALQISKLTSKIFNEVQKKEPFIESIKKTLQFDKNDPKSFLRCFYHFVLGNTDLEIEQLNGSNYIACAQEYIFLLKDYQMTFSSDDSTYQLLQNLIEQLNFGSQIYIAKRHSLNLDPFMERLNVFLCDPTQKSFSLIPGGYYNKDKMGHGVIYEIEREDNPQMFSFHIIDTGVIDSNLELCKPFAVNESLSKRALQREFIHKQDLIEESIVRGQQFMSLGNKNKTQRLSYIKLTAAQFSKSFFQDLSNVESSSNEDKEMKDILKYLDKHLALPNGENITASGQPYSKQKKGTCAQKSLAVWLHTKMGNEHYQKFKVFYTEKEIQALENLISIQESALDKLLANLSFSKLEITPPQEKTDNTDSNAIKNNEPIPKKIVELEPPLTEEELTKLQSILKKLTDFLKEFENWSYKNVFVAKPYSYSPQQAKEEIKKLAYQVLEKRKQKLKPLPTATATANAA